jgi:hypothetical protein
VATNENEPLVPTVKVVLLELVNTGALFTFKVKLCVPLVPTPLLAVSMMLNGLLLDVPAAGVPLRVPVPSPLSTNVTPLGKAPDSESDGLGKPEVITVNDPEAPSVKVALLTLVIAGAWSTVSVKVCVPFVPTPLLAVRVIE